MFIFSRHFKLYYKCWTLRCDSAGITRVNFDLIDHLNADLEFSGNVESTFLNFNEIFYLRFIHSHLLEMELFSGMLRYFLFRVFNLFCDKLNIAIARYQSVPNCLCIEVLNRPLTEKNCGQILSVEL